MVYTARLVVEYGHRKDICYDEIGLCAQIIDTILSSIINEPNWKDLCDHLNSMRNSNLTSHIFCILSLLPQATLKLENIRQFQADPAICGVGSAHIRGHIP